MVKLFPFFSSTPFGDEFIKSDAFKNYLQQMINDNKIEEIASIINDYTIIIDFEYLKSTLTNIFDLNLQNNKILKDFIKQKSYKLIAELLCSDHYYSYETTNPLSRIVNENNIININTAQVKRELDEKYNEGFDMLLGSEDIPYQFDIKSFIELCFKALFRITNSIDIDECKIIHNQLFTQKSKQIDSNITPQEVVNGANNNPIVQQQQRSLGR